MIHFFIWCIGLAVCAYIGYAVLMLGIGLLGVVLQGIAAMFRYVPNCGRQQPAVHPQPTVRPQPQREYSYGEMMGDNLQDYGS